LRPVAVSGTISIRGDARKLTQGDARSLATLLGSYIPRRAQALLVNLHKAQAVASSDFTSLQQVVNLTNRHLKGVYGSWEEVSQEDGFRALPKRERPAGMNLQPPCSDSLTQCYNRSPIRHYLLRCTSPLGCTQSRSLPESQVHVKH
jgi:hypothetical protein